MDTDLLLKIINRTIDKNMDPRMYGSDKHLMPMLSIALQIRAKNILELGTCSGRTAEPLLLAAQVNDGKFTTVDIAPIREGWECPEHLSKYFEFVESDAIKYLEDCVEKNKKFDLIYVDDWHSYEHVKKEIELLEKLITPSSIILLHDLMYDICEPNYNSRGENAEFGNGGPYKAVSELNPHIWEWATIPADNGLTILRKKSGVVFDNIQNYKNGWIIGDFLPSLLKTDQFEVAIHRHNAGFKGEIHYHKLTTEYNVIISGRAIICGREIKQGDIFIFSPNGVSTSEFLENTTLLVVRTPSIPTDKYLV